jgi:hypothetical protein
MHVTYWSVQPRAPEPNGFNVVPNDVEPEAQASVLGLKVSLSPFIFFIFC